MLGCLVNYTGVALAFFRDRAVRYALDSVHTLPAAKSGHSHTPEAVMLGASCERERYFGGGVGGGRREAVSVHVKTCSELPVSARARAGRAGKAVSAHVKT